MKKSARISGSPPVAEKKRQSGASIKVKLMPVLEDVLEEVEGVSKPMLLLDSHGNWPLCTSSKCKKVKNMQCIMTSLRILRQMQTQ